MAATRRQQQKPPTTTQAPKTTRNVPTWKERNVKRANDTVAWLDRLHEDWERSGIDPDAVQDITSARTYLDGVVETLGKLGDDWKPASKSRSNGKLAVGEAVEFVDADAAKNYAFIQDLSNRMQGATVFNVFDKNSLVVALNDGERTLIQKRHLQRASN